MAEQNNSNRQRLPSALREYSMRLVGDPVQGARRPPTLSFLVVKNKPVIEVRTNVEGDKDYGRIQAKLDGPTFFAVLQSLDEACAATGEFKVVYSINDYPFMNGQRSKEPKLDSRILIGKDKEGVVYIAVTSWDKARPIIKFCFRPMKDHEVAHGDGTLCSAAEKSVNYARAWINFLYGIMPQALYVEYVAPPPPDNNRGGNQGGGQRRDGNWGGGGGGNQNSGGGGGSGSSSSSSSDFTDDDFPGL